MSETVPTGEGEPTSEPRIDFDQLETIQRQHDDDLARQEKERVEAEARGQQAAESLGPRDELLRQAREQYLKLSPEAIERGQEYDQMRAKIQEQIAIDCQTAVQVEARLKEAQADRQQIEDIIGGRTEHEIHTSLQEARKLARANLDKASTEMREIQTKIQGLHERSDAIGTSSETYTTIMDEVKAANDAIAKIESSSEMNDLLREQATKEHEKIQLAVDSIVASIVRESKPGYGEVKDPYNPLRKQFLRETVQGALNTFIEAKGLNKIDNPAHRQEEITQWLHHIASAVSENQHLGEVYRKRERQRSVNQYVTDSENFGVSMKDLLANGYNVQTATEWLVASLGHQPRLYLPFFNRLRARAMADSDPQTNTYLNISLVNELSEKSYQTFGGHDLPVKIDRDSGAIITNSHKTDRVDPRANEEAKAFYQRELAKTNEEMEGRRVALEETRLQQIEQTQEAINDKQAQSVIRAEFEQHQWDWPKTIQQYTDSIPNFEQAIEKLDQERIEAEEELAETSKLSFRRRNQLIAKIGNKSQFIESNRDNLERTQQDLTNLSAKYETGRSLPDSITIRLQMRELNNRLETLNNLTYLKKR